MGDLNIEKLHQEEALLAFKNMATTLGFSSNVFDLRSMQEFIAENLEDC